MIALIDEWQDRDGSIQKRSANSDLAARCAWARRAADVKSGTLAHEIYGSVVTERHRHRYEANVNYLEQLQQAGLVISAITQREKLTEIVELPRAVHPGSWAYAVPPRVQVDALGRAPAVHVLHQGRAAAPGERASAT